MAEGRGWYGETAVDELLWRGIDQYRDHLELLYPFGFVALLAFFLEVRLETLELLFDFEDGFTPTVDREFLHTVFPERLAEQIAPGLEEIVWLVVLGLVGIVLLTTLAALVAVSIAFLVAADTSQSRDRRQFDRLWVALSRLPALVGAVVLVTLAVTVGLILLLVPGLYLAVKFALAGPAVVVGGHGPIAGLRESYRTVNGQFVDVAGLLTLSVLAIVLVGLVPIIGELIVALVVLPVVSLAFSSMYVDSLGPS